jgi:hypothetical protein
MTQVGLFACDAGDAPLSIGPRPRVVSYQPQPGQGLDCDPSANGCGFPVDQPLTFELDRWLLPSTATRQSIRVGPLGSDAGVHFEPSYDLVTRTVTYRPRGGWGDGYIYDLQLYDPTLGDDGWGFRSYDNQLLDPSGVPEHVLFYIGPPSGQQVGSAEHTTCREALRAFASAGCTRSNCHRAAAGATAGGGPLPCAGLALDSAEGLSSAVGRVARATDRGTMSGTPAKISERFGVNMPVISEGEPAMSLLMYRLVMNRDAYRRQDRSFAARPPSPIELERATSWFGVLGPMPPSDVGWPSDVAPVDLVITIQRWILGGATTGDCD